MKRRVVGLWRAFLGLIYPLTCYGCGAKIEENTGLCDRCVSSIHKNSSGIAACRYEGVLKQAIHLLKYKRVFPLLGTLSRLLADFVDKTIDMERIDAIIPVPLHPVKFRERTFNQARLLSLPIGRRYGIPIYSRALKKVKATRPQSGLNKRERAKNLKGAFVLRRGGALRGKRILLVDDIYTTGVTLANARSALKRSGVTSVKVVALAKGTLK